MEKEHELARLHPDPSPLPLAWNECVQSDTIVCCARWGGGGFGSSDSSGGPTRWLAPWMDEWRRTHPRCFLKSFILAGLARLGGASSNSLPWSCLLLPFDLCYIVFLELINSHFFCVFLAGFGIVSAQGTTYREALS